MTVNRTPTGAQARWYAHLACAPRMSPPIMPLREASGTLRRLWWVPLAFVTAVLVLLLGTPILVSVRIRHLRHELAEGSNSARVLVNDLEVAFATQLLLREEAHHQRAAWGAPYASAEAAARLRERHDELWS